VLQIIVAIEASCELALLRTQLQVLLLRVMRTVRITARIPSETPQLMRAVCR
jgi:hypothetical protein